MAREIKRRFDLAAFYVIIEVEDDFGNVSPHSIPLSSDKCAMCKMALPGTSGSADANATAEAIVNHVDSLQDALIAKFTLAAKGDPILLAQLDSIKAKRVKKDG